MKPSNTPHAGLIALRAPSHISQAGELPERLVMLRWGLNETAIGPKTVGLKTLRASEQWDALGFGEVAIDFQHNTVPGHESYRGEPAPIAAMAIPRVIEGEGLVFESIRWTPEGRANAHFYTDLSPAVKDDADGEVILCHSAALTRNGAVQGLHLFSAESIPDELRSKLMTLSAGGTIARINDSERVVMRQLAISESTWLRHTPSARLSTLSTGNIFSRHSPEDCAEMVRLRVSEAKWSRFNPPGLTTLSASPLNQDVRDQLISLLRLPHDATDEDLAAAVEAWSEMMRQAEGEAARPGHEKQLGDLKERHDALASETSHDAVVARQKLRAEIDLMKRPVGGRELQPLSARFASLPAEEQCVAKLMGISAERWLGAS